MKQKTFLATLALLTVLVAACTPLTPEITPPDTYTPPTPETNLELESFGSEEEFLTAFQQDEGGYFGGGMRMMRADSAVAEGAAMGVPSAAPIAQKVDYSETNVQVLGIDEADIIKTDGEHIYTITGQQVFILKAYPGKEAEVLTDISYENEAPQALFIEGDRLVVIGTRYRYYYRGGVERMIWPGPSTSNTFIDIYDISDADSPELVEEYHVEGAYFQGRLKDGYAYIATNSWSSYGGWPELPIILRGEEELTIAASTIFRYPIPYNNPQLTTIYSIEVDNPDDIESVSVVTEGGSTLYMSHENIFLGSRQNINTWEIQQEVMIDVVESELTEKDRRTINKIRDADPEVLSKQEKQSKMLAIISRHVERLSDDEQEAIGEEVERAYKKALEQFDYFEWTLLARIDYRGGRLKVEADGKVPGSLNNQFSLDEYKDVLRVATTVNPRWELGERTESTNHLFTLDSDLDVLDSVDHLAKGERIFSARYIEDKLYLVTFRQVDPFFVIDLSDPEDIDVLGELKIPGFSRYLHPYDENTIIGLGRDATLEGRQQGLKISLFDVSDVHNPQEIASYKEDGRYSSSSAEYEHKAFLFSKERNLLVIPVYDYDYQDKNYFNGVLVFDITKDDIDLRGSIDHSDETTRWRAGVERSLYIEELLYTKSYDLVRIHTLDDLDSVKDVELDIDEQKYYPEPYFAEPGIAIDSIEAEIIR